MVTCFLTPIKLSKAPSPILHNSLNFPRVNPDLVSSSSMESFTLPKLWSAPGGLVEEEEESFFELEFTLPEYDDLAGLDCVDQKIGRIGDFISPDPRAVRSKPQSPIAILRQSAPKLRVFMFGKPVKRSKQEQSSLSQTPNGSRRKTRVNFTLKLRFEDAASSAKKKLSRSNSLKRSSNGDRETDLDGFCKKYLNMLKKPLNVNSKQREPFVAASSPRKSDERANRSGFPVKTFGKCRSAGSLLVGASIQARTKDDSLAQQNDGIHGAIQHCKQSFSTCSKERRRMSRCASDTSHEKSYRKSA